METRGPTCICGIPRLIFWEVAIHCLGVERVFEEVAVRCTKGMEIIAACVSAHSILNIQPLMVAYWIKVRSKARTKHSTNSIMDLIFVLY